jgi:hypothetical protein
MPFFLLDTHAEKKKCFDRYKDVGYLIEYHRRWQDCVRIGFEKDHMGHEYFRYRKEDRYYYMEPRWLLREGDNKPVKTKGEKTYENWRPFTNEGYESDDEEGTVVVYRLDNNLPLWVEKLSAGERLGGQTVVLPTIGVLELKEEPTDEAVRRYGRIISTNDKICQLFFDPKQDDVDLYLTERIRRRLAKKSKEENEKGE